LRRKDTVTGELAPMIAARDTLIALLAGFERNFSSNISDTFSAGRRTLHLFKRMKHIFTTFGDKPETFVRGEIIYDFNVAQHSTDYLYFIEHGSATWEDPNEAHENSFVSINDDTTCHGMALGTGGLFGMLDILTPSAGQFDNVLRAWTDSVVVRRLHFDRRVEGEVPVKVGELTPRDVCDLYEALAYRLSEMCHETELRLSRLSEKANIMKDSDMEVGQAASKAERAALKDRFHISTTEQMLLMSEVDVQNLETDKKSPGKAYIFSSWLIATTHKGEDDRCVKISNITAMSSPTAADPSVVITWEETKIRGVRRLSAQLTPYDDSRETEDWNAKFVRSWITPGSYLERICIAMGVNLSHYRRSAGPDDTLASLPVGASQDMDSVDLRKPVLHDVELIFPTVVAAREFVRLLENRIRDTNKVAGMHNKVRKQMMKQDERRQQHGAKLTDYGYVYPEDQEDGNTDEKILKRIFSKHTKLDFAEGQTVLGGGCENSSLFHIVKGKAGSFGTQGMSVCEYFEGDILGELSYLDTGNKGEEHSILALSPLKIIRLDRDDIERLAAKHPSAALRVYRNIAIKLAIKLQMDLLSMRAWQTAS